MKTDGMGVPRYIAVTVCRNEEELIGRCVGSVLGQSYPPSCYVVVDDGSTDGTLDILRSFGSKIDVISLDRHHQFQRGGHLLRLFLLGVSRAKKQTEDWEFLLSVDADEVLGRYYVEKLVDKMRSNPRLGMTSGVPYSKTDGGYLKIERASFNVWNGARLYRRACFDEIHNIPVMQGWDVWIQFEANRLGWETKPFDDVNFLEERPWGDPGPLSFTFWARRGFVRRILGFSLLAQILSSFMRMTEKPYLLGSITFLLAFLLYGLQKNKLLPKDYYSFVKKHTIKMVRAEINKTISRARKKYSIWRIKK